MKKLLSAKLLVAFCVLAAPGFAQVVTVTSPVTNQSFKLPDQATFQSATDAQAAITTAEAAGKALLADGTKEKNSAVTAQSNFTKAKAEESAYLTAINSFAKNDVDPYKLDMSNYDARGKKYTDLLTKHNVAVKANNALPAKSRKPATVTALTKEKTQIDTMAAQLAKWKIKLDAAKAKLDVKNAALQKQQQKYTADEQSSAAKLKTSKTRLAAVLNQLTICASYAVQCKGLLTTKFKVAATTDAGYFESPAYKTDVAALRTELMQLNQY